MPDNPLQGEGQPYEPMLPLPGGTVLYNNASWNVIILHGMVMAQEAKLVEQQQEITRLRETSVAQDAKIVLLEGRLQDTNDMVHEQTKLYLEAFTTAVTQITNREKAHDNLILAEQTNLNMALKIIESGSQN